jgi:hypothetical protein
LQKDLKCSYGYLAVTAVHHWKSMEVGLKNGVNSGQLPSMAALHQLDFILK